MGSNYPDDFGTLYEQRHHPDGSSELVVRLTAEETAILGKEGVRLLEGVDWALRSLAEIRAGRWDEVITSEYDEGSPGSRQRQRMKETIFALETDLLPKLQGIRTVALRSARAQGASHADMADWMSVSRATAQSRWRALEAAPPSRWELWARGQEAAEQSPKVCDHTSVGVLIEDGQGRLLMFERATPPAGIAPPAGHGDDHGDPKQAARTEVAKEVGLTVVSLTQVSGGWQPNRCRRQTEEGRTAGHHWTIYRAEVTGGLRPSPRETRNARWLTRAQIQDLVDRTAAAARGEVPADAFAQAPGIEPVWVWWLHAVGLVDVPDDDLARVQALAEQPPA